MKYDKEAVRIFKALGDATRYRIMKMLMERGELSCADFDNEFKLSKPAMSHHYRILENAGLIETRKDGLHIYIRARAELVEKFLPNFTKTHLKK
jgi:Predicted transcriptional regulators